MRRSWFRLRVSVSSGRSTWPNAAVVELRLVGESEGCISCLEFARAPEETVDIAIAVIGRHSVPHLGLEHRSIGFNQSVNFLRHGAVRRRRFGDLGQTFLLCISTTGGRRRTHRGSRDFDQSRSPKLTASGCVPTVCSTGTGTCARMPTGCRLATLPYSTS